MNTDDVETIFILSSNSLITPDHIPIQKNDHEFFNHEFSNHYVIINDNYSPLLYLNPISNPIYHLID